MKAVMLYNYYKNLTTATHQGLYNVIVRLALVVHVVELLALLVLTYISSSDNYGKYQIFIL